MLTLDPVVSSQASLDSIPHIVWLTDAGGAPLFFNQKWWSFTGLCAEEYFSDAGAEVVHPDDRAEVLGRISQNYRNGTPFELQYRLRSKSGEYVWHIGRMNPVHDPDGTLVSWIGTATDIDRYKREESQLRLVSDIVPSAIVYVDVNERYLYANQFYETGYGRIRDQTIGRTMREVLGEERYRHFEPYVRRALAGESVTFEVEMPHLGVIKNTRISYVPHRSASGRVRGFAAIAHDITNEKRVRAEIESALRSRDILISVASHELLTPVTSLVLRNQLLGRALEQGELPTRERLQTLVDQNLRQLRRLQQLVADMLDTSRINLGKLSMQKSETDLSELCRQVAEQHSTQLAQAGCSLSTELESNLRGHWDGYRLEQVVSNLLSNACRYARSSPITVSTRRVGRHAELIVADQGPGIAPDNHARIFQRFERATSDEGRGLGLGLFIVKQIVEAHQGEVKVESELGRGARFVIRLPLAAEE